MRKHKILSVLIFITTISQAIPTSINSPVDGTGWRYNQHNPGGSYAGISGANDGYAWDINYGSGWDDDGLPVYAVEEGCIYTGNGWGGNTYGQLLINHTTGSDNWSSGYLHMKNIVKKTGCVKKGEKIGEISRTGYLVNSAITAPHLHFAVYTSHGKYGIKSADITINETSYPLTDSISTNKISGIFDGAGSIINPNGEGYGENYDIANMHPHSGTGSTVVFQWLYDKDTCSQLDISSQYDIGDVIIKSKKWSEHLTEKSFKVKLNEDAPITMKRPDSNPTWITFAVTSTKSLTFSNMIKAVCKTSDDRFKTGIRSDIDKDLVDVTYDYYWTGTGSIISNVNREFNPPYGMTADLASTFRTTNSLTSFQWLKQGDCQKLKISASDGSSSSVNGVHIKVWDVEDWGDSKCNSLPCTLNPYNNDFYVIKIKSSPDAISSGQLSAECVE